VLQDPAFVTGHNTLGVIYLRHGMAREAQQVFDEVLAREPENTKVMGNLVHALRQQGRDAEASKVAARLAAIEPYPPFHYFNAGLEAMRAQDYAQARDLFAKELRREAYYHEFHFWLAQAELALGNVRQAQRHLLLAQQTSTTARDHDLYAAKLDRLRSYAR
jgi:Tfp pilus assembly protein PilF